MHSQNYHTNHNKKNHIILHYIHQHFINYQYLEMLKKLVRGLQMILYGRICHIMITIIYQYQKIMYQLHLIMDIPSYHQKNGIQIILLLELRAGQNLAEARQHALDGGHAVAGDQRADRGAGNHHRFQRGGVKDGRHRPALEYVAAKNAAEENDQSDNA